MDLYCGIDLGARRSHVCVVDARGDIKLERGIENELASMAALFASLGGTMHVVVESTFNWYWLADGLVEHGYSVTLAHPLALRAITGARVKTDKRDARKLAQLHRLGAIPRAAIIPKHQRTIRDIMRRRIHLVRQRATELGSLRRLIVGQSASGRLLVTVFAEMHEDEIRIISARRATSHERKHYEEG